MKPQQVRVMGSSGPRLGTVTLHDRRDNRHVMGCPKCQGLPLAPQSGDYTIPFWEGVESEKEKWDRYRS